MKIGILKEATETEQRVALVPQIAQLLSKTESRVDDRKWCWDFGRIQRVYRGDISLNRRACQLSERLVKFAVLLRSPRTNNFFAEKEVLLPFFT